MRMTPRYDVVLVAMPFAPLRAPSIGLGLLHSAVTKLNVSCKTMYFNISFAKLISAGDYLEILQGRSNSTEDLVGEWLFSGSLFGDDALDVDGYVEQILRGGASDHRLGRGGTNKLDGEVISRILTVRSKVSQFLDVCVEEIEKLRPKLVGLTSMFQQHVPSLALAKRLREKLPESFIVMGGSNCEGPMGVETAENFQFLDAVVSGEADIVFPHLVDRVVRGERVGVIKGVSINNRNRNGIQSFPSNESNASLDEISDPILDMNSLPWPNYDDYFQQLTAAKLDSTGGEPQLMYETARGCWWGQKNQCTFCGLNGTTKKFRSKSPERALDELEYLVRRFPGRNVAVTDNILDPRYLRTFLPMLRDRNLGVQLFYEVKSNLKKADVQLLREAGVCHIQPGIESLSTAVLKLMRKGVTGIQNVQLLKWCLEVGVTPIWGLLWGFPGEKPAEYLMMKELVPFITHLPAPEYVTRIRLDRFSPNFNSAEAIGLWDVSPYRSYSFIYPLPSDTISNLAYFFRYSYRDKKEDENYTSGVQCEIRKWQKQQPNAALVYLDKKSCLIIVDLRPGSKEVVHVLDKGLRDIYLQCDQITSLHILQKMWDFPSLDFQIEAALEYLIDARLMMREENNYLSLAVNLEKYRPSAAVIEHLGRVMEQFDDMDGSHAT